MEKVIEIFQKLTNLPVTSFRLLPGGLTNNNYLINDCYVLRVRKNFIPPGLDPYVEEEVERLLSGKPYVTELIAFNAQEGIKITKYLEGGKPFDSSTIDEKSLKKIATVLYDLHHSNLKVNEVFDVTSRINEYKMAYPFQSLPNENAIILNAEKYLKDAEKTLCHNDVVPGNILLKNEELYLLDYEYAMMNDPFFDLVSFLSENDIVDPKMQKKFLTFYYQKYEPWMAEKLQAYFFYLDLLWYHWAKMMYHQEKEIVYQQIADIKLQRLNKF